MPKITNSPDGPTYAEGAPGDGVVWHDRSSDVASRDLDPDEGDVRDGRDGAVARPASGTSRAVWVEYAVSRGWSRVEAERLSRAQLVARLSERS